MKRFTPFIFSIALIVPILFSLFSQAETQPKTMPSIGNQQIATLAGAVFGVQNLILKNSTVSLALSLVMRVAALKTLPINKSHQENRATLK